MDRINIIGPTGAGKSTLARALATRAQCANIDLDALYWRPGCRRMPQLADPASGWRASYALFARGGFTAATRAEARELGVRLVTLDEIEDALAAEV